MLKLNQYYTHKYRRGVWRPIMLFNDGGYEFRVWMTDGVYGSLSDTKEDLSRYTEIPKEIADIMKGIV